MKKILSIITVAVLAFGAFTACSSKGNSQTALTSEQLAEVVNNSGSEMTEYNPAVAFDSKSEDLDAFMERQEWDKANFERGAVSFSIMNVQAYTIAVVKPAEGQTETVKQYFADYKARTEKDFERYLEDQYEIAKSAVIDEKDGYVIFVMDEDADSIAETIKSKI